MNRAKKKQELIEHYLDFYNVALSMLRNEDDAKDVVQEALVRTLVKVGLRNPAGYCMVAVKHLSVDRLRHRQQLTRIDEMTLVADCRQEDLLSILEQKKKELPQLAQAAIDLHYGEGYTLSQVAAIMGLSLSSLKRLLCHARNDLKTKIETEI